MGTFVLQVNFNQMVVMEAMQAKPLFQIRPMSQSKFEPDPTALANLEGMGFPKEQAIKALECCMNNAEIACMWLLEHPMEEEPHVATPKGDTSMDEDDLDLSGFGMSPPTTEALRTSVDGSNPITSEDVKVTDTADIPTYDEEVERTKSGPILDEAALARMEEEARRWRERYMPAPELQEGDESMMKRTMSSQPSKMASAALELAAAETFKDRAPDKSSDR
jgi:hypothetical protein